MVAVLDSPKQSTCISFGRGDTFGNSSMALLSSVAMVIRIYAAYTNRWKVNKIIPHDRSMKDEKVEEASVARLTVSKLA